MSSSLSRAFTTRRAKLGLDLKDTKDFLGRSSSTKTNNAIRPKISGPVQLVHTTNMLSYNAPDIESSRRIPSSSHSSVRSDSDSLSGPASASTSPPTSPEASICERPSTPEMFDITPGPKSPLRNRASTSDMQPPVIPRRAPSHTKKASIEAMRHRSGSITRSPSAVTRSPISVVPASPSRSVVSKSSMTFLHNPASSIGTTATFVSSGSFAGIKSPLAPTRAMSIPETPYDVRSFDSPFGQELAQVAEIAEEFGVKHKLEVIDEEERDLHARGLRKYAPDSYIKDVQTIRLSFFPDSVPLGGARPAPVWI